MTNFNTIILEALIILLSHVVGVDKKRDAIDLIQVIREELRK